MLFVVRKETNAGEREYAGCRPGGRSVAGDGFAGAELNLEYTFEKLFGFGSGNGYPADRVVPEQRNKKILDAVRTLDYVPNINARRLFSNRSGVFGLVLPRFDFPMRRMFEDQHLMRILAGIEETISPEGYRVLLIFADRDFVSGKEYLNIFRSKQLDGVFIWGAASADRFYAELGEHGYPHVFITTRPDCGDPAACFRGNYTEASRLAVEHLLEKGHRRIGWCANGDDVTSLQGELDLGIRQALAAKNLGWDETIVPMRCNYLYSHGCEFAEAFAPGGASPVSALLFVSHDSARGCCDVFSSRGIRIPEECAVACCDSLVEEKSILKITRVAMDDFEIGAAAARRLLKTADSGTDSGDEEKLPVIFVPGETT